MLYSHNQELDLFLTLSF